jgi:hypothetical protein
VGEAQSSLSFFVAGLGFLLFPNYCSNYSYLPSHCEYMIDGLRIVNVAWLDPIAVFSIQACASPAKCHTKEIENRFFIARKGAFAFHCARYGWMTRCAILEES